MTDIYLSIEHFAQYEGLSPNTIRARVSSYPIEHVIPRSGRGKKGGTLLSTALLSPKGRRHFLGDPNAHGGSPTPKPASDSTRSTAPMWLRVREAARRWSVGNARLTARTLRRWIAQGKLARGTWRKVDGGYDVHLTALPDAAQIAYYLEHGLELPQRLRTPLPKAGNGNLEDLTAEQRQTALAWGRRLAEYERILRETGWTKAAAAQAFCEAEPNLTPGTLSAMYRKWLKADRDVSVLAPKLRTGRPLKPVSPLALNWMYRHYIDSNLANKRLSARATIAKAHSMGWKPMVSLDTLVRYLVRMPAQVRIATQGGANALDDTFLPGTLRAYDMPAMEVWIGDHHQFDVMVRMPNGTPARLWVTAWQDMRSRKMVGWEIVLQPNSASIATAFYMAAKQYGAPNTLLIDNGADYTCYKLIGTEWQKRKQRFVSEQEDTHLKGAFEICGVEKIMRAIEYNAESKPVERTFRTHEEQFCAQLPGYCGRDHKARKRIEDRLGHRIEESDLLDVDEFVSMYERYILEVYHTAEHSGEGMQGRSPNECFEAERHEAAYVPAANLEVLFLTPIERSIGRYGFRLYGQYYRNPELQHLYFDPKQPNAKRKFLLRYNPKDLSEVRVYSRDTDRFLGIAPLVGRTQYTSEDEIERRKREHKRYRALRSEWWGEQERLLNGETLPPITPAERVGLSKESAAAVANDTPRKASGGDAPIVRLAPKAEDAATARKQAQKAKTRSEALVSTPEPSTPGGKVIDFSKRTLRQAQGEQKKEDDVTALLDAALAPERHKKTTQHAPADEPDAADLIDAALASAPAQTQDDDAEDEYFGY